jgi:hypothetical protein
VRYAIGLVTMFAACRIDFDPHASTDAPRPKIDASPDRYRAAVMADHPVAYWRLGDTGTVARDELAAHDATYSGGVTVGQLGAIVGTPNTAAAFAAPADGQAITATGIPFADQSPFTLELWVNETDNASYWHFLTSEPRVQGMPQAGYALLQTGTGVLFERIADPATFEQTAPSPIVAHAWTHLAGVYDGAHVTLYVDGVVVRSAEASHLATGFERPIFLGAHAEGAWMDGALDEVAIYDSALPAARLLAHYTIGTGGN